MTAAIRLESNRTDITVKYWTGNLIEDEVRQWGKWNPSAPAPEFYISVSVLLC